MIQRELWYTKWWIVHSKGFKYLLAQLIKSVQIEAIYGLK